MADRDFIDACARTPGRVPSLIHEHKAFATGKTGENDADYAPVEVRLSRYAPAHQRALDMAAYLRTIDINDHDFGGGDRSHYPTELERCGQYLEFDTFPERQASLLSAAMFCQRFRLCPFCAMRRCARSLQDNAPKVRKVFAETKVANAQAWAGMLTLTVRNGEDLRERFQHLVNSWRSVMQRRRYYLAWLNRGKRGKAQPFTFAAMFSGGAYSIEIKRGKGSGGWHPHLHALVLVDGPLDEQRVRNEWEEVTGDSFQCRLVPCHSMADSGKDSSDEALAADLVEVLKYPLKFSDISLPDNWHAELVLAGRRLRGTFGSLRGVVIDPAELTDYAAEFADLPFVKIAAQWMGDEYRLVDGAEHRRWNS